MARRAGAKQRVAPYFRASLDRFGRMKSVTDQSAEYEEDRAEQPGWLEVARFSDNSLSASRFARKAREDFGKLVALIEAGDVDLVWLWEVSRFARDLATFVPLRELCRQRGLKWYVHDEMRTYDFTRLSDVEELTNRALKAEQESELLSRRTRRGVRANLRNGKPHGRPKYGYRRRYDERTRELIAQEVDPVEAPVVEEIARRFGAGVAINVIKTDLEKRVCRRPTAVRCGRQ